MAQAVLIFYRVPNAVTHFNSNFVNFKVARKGLVDVGVIYVDRVQVWFHLQKVEWDHLAAEILRGLVLEKPLVIVLLAVEELVHFVFLPFDLVFYLLAMFEHHFLGSLGPHVDRENLFCGGLHTQKLRLFQRHALLFKSGRPRVY